MYTFYVSLLKWIWRFLFSQNKILWVVTPKNKKELNWLEATYLSSPSLKHDNGLVTAVVYGGLVAYEVSPNLEEKSFHL